MYNMEKHLHRILGSTLLCPGDEGGRNSEVLDEMRDCSLGDTSTHLTKSRVRH